MDGKTNNTVLQRNRTNQKNGNLLIKLNYYNIKDYLQDKYFNLDAVNIPRNSINDLLHKKRPKFSIYIQKCTFL